MPYKYVIVNEKEIKIYILYVLKILKSFDQTVTFDLLSEVINWEGAVNYFDFSEQFAFLVESGSVIENLEKGKGVYEISEKGTMIIDTMEKVLLSTVRDSAMRSIMRFFSFKKDGSLYLNEIVPEDNGWRIRCYLKCSGRIIVEANIFSENRAYLDKMSINFEENATRVIDGIIGFMTGDIDFFFND